MTRLALGEIVQFASHYPTEVLYVTETKLTLSLEGTFVENRLVHIFRVNKVSDISLVQHISLVRSYEMSLLESFFCVRINLTFGILIERNSIISSLSVIG